MPEKPGAGWYLKWTLYKLIALACGVLAARGLGLAVGISLYEIFTCVVAGALAAVVMLRLVYTRPDNRWIAVLSGLAAFAAAFFVYGWIFDWASASCPYAWLSWLLLFGPVIVGVYLIINRLLGSWEASKA